MKFLPVATLIMNENGVARTEVTYIVSSIAQAQDAFFKYRNLNVIVCVDVPRSQVVTSAADAIRFFEGKS